MLHLPFDLTGLFLYMRISPTLLSNDFDSLSLYSALSIHLILINIYQFSIFLLEYPFDFRHICFCGPISLWFDWSHYLCFSSITYVMVSVIVFFVSLSPLDYFLHHMNHKMGPLDYYFLGEACEGLLHLNVIPSLPLTQQFSRHM